jgi:hypothetical protein
LTIKNLGAKQTRQVKRLNAQSRVALTVTPVENRLSYLWSLFDFTHPGLLGTEKVFASEHLPPRGIRATLAGARETHTGVVPQREVLFLAGIAISQAPQFCAGRGDSQVRAARVRIALT